MLEIEDDFIQKTTMHRISNVNTNVIYCGDCAFKNVADICLI